MEPEIVTTEEIVESPVVSPEEPVVEETPVVEA